MNTPSRHGKEWTKKEDKQLKKFFEEGLNFAEMGKRLNRTWFACKCRLARLELIEPFANNHEDHFIGSLEPFRVPNQNAIPKEVKSIIEYMNMDKKQTEELCSCLSGHISSEGDTSNTFSTTELNVVTDYLKTRLARVVCALADGEHCFIKLTELKQAKEFLENEIKVANNMKKIKVEDREKVLKRLC